MKIFSLVFIILGYFLGAGFVSGKEIATYFSVYGKFSILGIIVATIVLFLLILFFLNLSEKVNNFSDFVSIYFGKLSWLINFLFAVCVLIIISSMFAGNRVISGTLNLNGELFTIIVSIISCLIVFFSFKGLSLINNVCVPIILIVVFIVSKTETFADLTYVSNIMGTIVSSINYVFINIVTLGLLILEVGNKFTKKEKIISALIVSLIIFILMFMSNNAILLFNQEREIMPLLNIANNKSTVLWLISSITIWIGLFTTLISCIYIFSNYLITIIRNRLFSIILTILLGVVISYLGFDVMVGYVYSIIGVVGVFMVFRVFVKEKQPLKFRGVKN